MNATNQPRYLADHTVTPCRPGDPRLIACGYSETAVGFEQTEGGPTFLVIGHHAPEDAIERGCLRFNLDRLQVMTALGSTEDQAAANVMNYAFALAAALASGNEDAPAVADAKRLLLDAKTRELSIPLEAILREMWQGLEGQEGKP